MKKLMKKAAGLGMAAVMALSMSAMAFAQDAPGYVTFFKSTATTNAGEVSMTQLALGEYESKVQVVDGEDVKYVYTINLESFEMTRMGMTGEGELTGITLGTVAAAVGIEAEVAGGSLVVTVPAEFVTDGNSALYDATMTSVIEFASGSMTMPSAVKLAITASELTYVE